jgi:hypothetical protein
MQEASFKVFIKAELLLADRHAPPKGNVVPNRVRRLFGIWIKPSGILVD